mgnify:CR=1 FL=1
MPLQKFPTAFNKRSATLLAGLVLCASTSASFAQSPNLAPNFTSLPNGAKVVMMPTDIELFSISGGGVQEPKADWTEAASKHFKNALGEKNKKLGLNSVDLSDEKADSLAEINALHAAVATSISWHHFGGAALHLPTKEDKLDWSIGEAALAVKQKTGADYALFSWVRDSYMSAERKAAMVLLAIAGIGISGGAQIGYASLVDLNTGRVVWFNQLARGTGDLREADAAKESVDALLAKFPEVK